MFVKKAWLTTTTVVYSMPGVNKAHLSLITGIDTSPRNKSCCKAVGSYQNKDVAPFFPAFPKKAGLRLCVKSESTLCDCLNVNELLTRNRHDI